MDRVVLTSPDDLFLQASEGALAFTVDHRQIDIEYAQEAVGEVFCPLR